MSFHDYDTRASLTISSHHLNCFWSPFDPFDLWPFTAQLYPFS